MKIVGSNCGLLDARDGATHQSIEEIAIVRIIPNMSFILPVDAEETRRVGRAAAYYNGPIYIRISLSLLTVIADSKSLISIGN